MEEKSRRELKKEKLTHTHTSLLACYICANYSIITLRAYRQTDRHPIAYCGWLGRMEGSSGVHFVCRAVDNEMS
jgi:hypothetical protein